jgi:DNA polymerase
VTVNTGDPTGDLGGDIRHQARLHLEALRLAGVEWLAMPPRRLRPAPPARTSDTAPAPPAASGTAAVAVAGSLFDAAPAAAPALSGEQKRLALKTLNEDKIIGCPKCPELARTRTQTVFGVGNPDAELCFVGEAPGADEDAQGEPFVGAAGQLLNRIIAACKMSREEVYIANILKCRPPGNRTPLPTEVGNCFPYLEEQLGIIRPKFICALGSVAAQALLNTQAGIGRLRGRFHSFRGIPVLCTYHPAYLLRNPAAKRDVWEDMKLLMARMGRPVA